MNKRKRGEVPFSTTLPPSLCARLKDEAQERQIPQKQIILSALTDFFSPAGEERDVLARRLTRIQEKQKALDSKLEILSETLALFIQVWFSNTFELAEEEKKKANEQGAKRFERFLGLLAKRVADDNKASRSG
jgi:hypothetical protein